MADRLDSGAADRASDPGREGTDGWRPVRTAPDDTLGNYPVQCWAPHWPAVSTADSKDDLGDATVWRPLSRPPDPFLDFSMTAGESARDILNTPPVPAAQHFTVVFEGDIRKLPLNPFLLKSAFGRVVACGEGDAFAKDTTSPNEGAAPAVATERYALGRKLCELVLDANSWEAVADGVVAYFRQHGLLLAEQGAETSEAGDHA